MISLQNRIVRLSSILHMILKTTPIFLCILVLHLFTACRSITPSYNYRELARAGIALNLDIDENDNHQLYLEAAKWIGVPHSRGKNKQGIDCSGLTCALFNKVYRIKLERSSDGQLKKNCYKIGKQNLKEGDLVFFHGKSSKRKASHVGTYLKNNKFIHTSTSRGVIVSDLNEYYWKTHWLTGGRSYQLGTYKK